MRIIPKLNLNKHPYEVDDGSLIDATNVMLSDDNSVLQSDLNFEIHAELQNALSEADIDGVIIFCIPCNKELVIFVSTRINFLSIYRYNEETKTLVYCTDTDYSNGNLVGTFTYNNENLIIAFSEYFDSNYKNIPLKVINLGKFGKSLEYEDYETLINYNKHPIVPEVRIPKCNIALMKGIAYKGWYYIFIRFKIGNNNYTQWYNTNSSVFVDDYINSNLLQYFTPKEVADKFSQITEKVDKCSIIRNTISDSKDISTTSFLVNLSVEYNNYQLGFICVSKSYTKCFRSEDLSKINNNFIFDSNNVVEYPITNIITSYYNYYNVKTICNNSNRLYIGNYKENSLSNNIVESLINNDFNITIRPDFKKVEHIKSTTSWNDTRYYVVYTYNVSSVTIELKKDKYGFYHDCTTMPIVDTITNKLELYNCKKEDVIGLKIIGIVPLEKHKAGELLCYPFIKNNKNRLGIMIAAGDEALEGEGYKNTLDKINDDYIKNKRFIFYYENYNTKLENNHSQAIISSDNVLYTNSILPGTYYNLFVHFVDKYGISTDGIPFSNFNVKIDSSNDTQEYNESGYFKYNNGLLYISDGYNISNFICLADIKLNKIIDNYIGYFISYEKIEKTSKYYCFTEETQPIDLNSGYNITVYTDKFNYEDKLDFNFNKLRVYYAKGKDINYSTNTFYSEKEYAFDDENAFNYIYMEFDIKDIKLSIADSNDNIGRCTRLDLNVDLNGAPISTILNSIVLLYRDLSDNLYNSKNKQLIPATEICYNVDTYIEFNTKNCFISNNHALINLSKMFYNDSVFYFQGVDSIAPIRSPYNFLYGYVPTEVPMESLQYNNAPQITMFPDKGLNTTNEYEKSFYGGYVVTLKNTTDLYQQKQVSVYENYPKYLTNFNQNIRKETSFPQTIRRSNIIQDESTNIAWRQFETEQYKYIAENKGDIIKLISIGKYFIVHTQHSMFLFDSSNTIQASKENIQLSNTDIWDINYKEVMTSTLGYAGLQKEYNGIVGQFGYIFFDKDSNELYKYDNDNISIISDDIRGFLNKAKNYGTDVTFVDDIRRNRLIITFSNIPNGNIETPQVVVLTYNYKVNSFISKISNYPFNKGYNTKNNTYFIYRRGTTIVNNQVYRYSNNSYCDSIIKVLINTDYFSMKYLDYIMYNISLVIQRNINDYSPVEGLDTHYAGDIIRIYSQHCDTGEISINVDENTINKIEDYTKPYWRMSNWHFNAIRNKLAEYIQGNNSVEENSRVYGNWFVIELHTKGSRGQTEFESINCSFTNAENI